MKTIRCIVMYVTCIVLSLQFLYGQTWQWAKNAGGYSLSYGQFITMGGNGNVFCMGGYHYFNHDALNFDTIYFNASGEKNMFLTSYKQNGDFVTATVAKGTDAQNDNIFLGNMTADKAGNIYTCGNIYGKFLIDTIGLPWKQAAYVAKFNADAHCLWVKILGGFREVLYGVTVDDTGNVYIAGQGGDVSWQIDTFTIYNNGGINKPKMFLAKLDSTGKCQWAKQGFNAGCGFNKCIYNNNYIYVTGGADTCVVFDTTEICSPTHGRVGFIVKSNMDGSIKWVAQYYSTGGEGISSISVDRYGNTYAIGRYANPIILGGQTLTPGNNQKDAFFAKYDSLGQLVWVRQLHGTKQTEITAMHTNDDGYTYITGYFLGTAVFGDDTVNKQGNGSMFVARYNSTGDCMGIVQLTGVPSNGITQDAAGNAYITGMFYSGAVDFGNTHLTAININGNFYVTKLSTITGGIASLTEDNNYLNIYANPNKGKFTIEVPKGIIQSNNALLNIYDNAGKLVKEEKVDISNGKVQANLGTVNKGIYSVLLSSSNKKYTGRVVIE